MCVFPSCGGALARSDGCGSYANPSTLRPGAFTNKSLGVLTGRSCSASGTKGIDARKWMEARGRPGSLSWRSLPGPGQSILLDSVGSNNGRGTGVG